MPRGRHTATRLPPVVFVVLCLVVASCLAGSQAAPLASVRQTRAQGSFVLVPPPVGIQAMLGLAWSGRLGDTVVIALGTNGPFSRIQLDRIVALAAGRRLVMLTNYCPYCSWVP